MVIKVGAISLVDQGLGLFVVLSPDSFSSVSFRSKYIVRPRFPPGVGGRGVGRTEDLDLDGEVEEGLHHHARKQSDHVD